MTNGNRHALSYRAPTTRVATSPIQGLGLFATEALPAGTLVAMKGGSVLTREVWDTLTPGLGPAEFQIADDLVIAPQSASERDGSMIFLNHSCDPNCAIQGQIAVVTMLPVAPGEELTHDWATTDDDDYEMACRCGTRRCRGTVTGKDWLDPELRVRYRGWFCWYLQRRIDAGE
ncbi:MAG: SET domain-containing protein-lysine N-methyltransferase [Pseudomonadota bacterium]